MNTNYQNQKIVILGMGLSGQSMAQFLQKRGAQVFGFDNRKGIENTLCKTVSCLEDLPLKEINLIAYSPGVKETHPLIIWAKNRGISTIGEIELGAREIKAPCVGITGTNGKSTVTSLITHLLNVAGKPAYALGNIGLPLTSMVEHIRDQICVVELSSYQIDSLQSPFLDTALILNITPDHMDRYGTFVNYARSKYRIQKFIKPKGHFYLEQSLAEMHSKLITFNPTQFYNTYLDELLNRLSPNQKVLDFFKNKNSLEKLNYSAAIAACQSFHISDEQIIEGIMCFKGLPHRCEYIGSINERAFYNDSKATNVESVIKAVTSFNSSLHLIMGGQDKGLDFSPLLPYFKNKVKSIYAIGEVRQKMQQIMSSDIGVSLCQSLEEALQKAYAQSSRGDVVLLSPACSSFDMFKNFEHRGNEFKRIVNQMKGESA